MVRRSRSHTEPPGGHGTTWLRSTSGGWWADRRSPTTGHPCTAARFAEDVRPAPRSPPACWPGPSLRRPGTSSMSTRPQYVAGVERDPRAHRGEATFTRPTSAGSCQHALPDPASDVAGGLASTARGRQPGTVRRGFLRLPEQGVSRRRRRHLSCSSGGGGPRCWSPVRSRAPGVQRPTSSPKDEAENIMIVDLVRNDLGRCLPYPARSRCPTCSALEQHPGLVHLVSTVLRRAARAGYVLGRTILAATFPPGSVTGAPKSSALRIIDEPRDRGAAAVPTAGPSAGWTPIAIGTAELAVGDPYLLGRGRRRCCGSVRAQGITWGSATPYGEWD